MRLLVALFVLANPEYGDACRYASLCRQITLDHGRWCLSVGENQQSVVGGIALLNVIENWLVTGSASSRNRDLFLCTKHRLDLAHLRVELTNIDLDDSIAEESVDAAVEVGKHFGRDTTRSVNGYKQSRIELTGAAHLQEACASVRSHSGQLTMAAQHRTAESLHDLPFVNARFGAGFDTFYQVGRKCSPVGGSFYQFVDLLALQ